MKIKLFKLWESLRSSFWFVPTLMVVMALALSIVTIGLDESGDYSFSTPGLTYTRGADGARAILSSIASSMITVATTAFSIVIVALQLASGQFGPRLLRNFIRDRGNQIVLGTFISTFLYCLLVLRTINGDEESKFVPHISVTCGVGLALASIGVLIYFIHHSAQSIQAQHVIAEVGHELNESIEHLFPNKIGRGALENKQKIEANIPPNFEQEASLIKSMKSGYLQAIDDEKLMKIATENNLILRLNYRPGKFIVFLSDIVMAWPGERVNKKLVNKINNSLVLGKERTQQQDLEFSVNQLVEIAVRALSPGINDPFTAIRCIDQLTVALCHLAQRNIPSAYRYDDQNKLRIIAAPVTFAGVTDAAFNQIRQYGQSSVAVTIRLLEAIAIVATQTQNESDKAALGRHAKMIERGSHEAVTEEGDSKDIEERYQAVLRALGQLSQATK